MIGSTKAHQPLPVLTAGVPCLERTAAEVGHGDSTVAAEIGRMHATLDQFRPGVADRVKLIGLIG
jgi:hypothetical protein